MIPANAGDSEVKAMIKIPGEADNPLSGGGMPNADKKENPFVRIGLGLKTNGTGYSFSPEAIPTTKSTG